MAAHRSAERAKKAVAKRAIVVVVGDRNEWVPGGGCKGVTRRDSIRWRGGGEGERDSCRTHLTGGLLLYARACGGNAQF